MGYGVGVDLGTTFAGVAVRRNGATSITTLPARCPASGPAIPARPALPLTSGRALPGPVPLMLGGAPPALPVLEGTLRSVLDHVTATEGEAPGEVVLTCPAVWGPVRREQFGEISRRVGLSSVGVVTGPEAAVRHLVAAGRLGDGDVVVVYDIGAMTIDLTVVRAGETGPEILGLPEALEGVAGADFDDVLLARVDQALDGTLSHLGRADPAAAAVLTSIRTDCVRAKEALSSSASTTVVARLPWGVVTVDLTRAGFESIIRTGLESTLTGMYRVMGSAGVGPADLAAVVLIGGSSRIPLVADLLADRLDGPVLIDEHPQHCAALGAAELTLDRSGSTGPFTGMAGRLRKRLRATPGPSYRPGIAR